MYMAYTSPTHIHGIRRASLAMLMPSPCLSHVYALRMYMSYVGESNCAAASTDLSTTRLSHAQPST
jgi:hypothetical protein